MTELKNEKKIDILADLFKESSSEPTEGLEKLRELAYRKRPSAEIDTESNHPGILQKNGNPTEPDRELSYAISKSTVTEEGAPKVKIKIVVPKSIEHQVSMPKIVDYAIESFLEELKSAVEEGTDS